MEIKPIIILAILGGLLRKRILMIVFAKGSILLAFEMGVPNRAKLTCARFGRHTKAVITTLKSFAGNMAFQAQV